MKPTGSIEHILGKLSDMREELQSLERAPERIEASDSSGETTAAPAIRLKLAL
jgi:hypothetical protein